MSERDPKAAPRVGRARLPRQDATGVDAPAGEDARQIDAEEYEPAQITGGGERDRAPDGERE